MDARMREAVRYLGYGGHAVDEQTLALIEDSFRELDRQPCNRENEYCQQELKEESEGLP